MSIGRLYGASPFMGERYNLRILLTVVWGATRFKHMGTVDRVVYQTFKATYMALRLLKDNGKWVAMFRDGQEFMTGRALRHLFAMALQHTTITNPLLIWQQFGNSFRNDLSHLIDTGWVVIPGHEADIDAEPALDYGLYHIQPHLDEYGKSLADVGLPHPQLNWGNMQGEAVGNILVREEMGYEMEQQRDVG